jgi:hypothetical protein
MQRAATTQKATASDPQIAICFGRSMTDPFLV